MEKKKIFWTTEFSRKTIESYEPGAKVQSEKFTLCAPNTDIINQFYLEVYPKGYADTEKGYYMSVYLKLIGELQSNMGLTFELIGKNDKSLLSGSRFVLKSDYTNVELDKLSWGVNKFILLKSILEQPEKYTPNGEITICISIELFESSNSTSFESHSMISDLDETIKNRSISKRRRLTEQPSQPSYLSNYKELYTTRSFSDVKLITREGKTLKAHKIFLASHSPVFKSIFNNNSSDEVDVKEFRTIVVDEMLRYIYYQQIENIQDYMFELYKLAFKFEIENVKQLCVSEMEKHIPMRFTEIIRLSETYQIEQLFTKCVMEIKQKFSRFKNDGTLSKLDSSMLIKIIGEMATKPSPARTPMPKSKKSLLIEDYD